MWVRDFKSTLRAFCFLAIAWGCAIPASAGPVVDRVITNVNGHVLLQSDWEEEVAFEAFIDGRDVDSYTSAERLAALDRLIDQELLREQVRPTQSASEDDAQAKLAEVRKLRPDCTTDDKWHAALQRYGLTEAFLKKRLSDQMQLMRLVQDRLRPSVQVDEKAIESYYHNELVPNLKKAGTNVKPLTEVYAKIKSVLAEQKMNELLTGWLASLRSGSQIIAPDPKSAEGNR